MTTKNEKPEEQKNEQNEQTTSKKGLIIYIFFK